MVRLRFIHWIDSNSSYITFDNFRAYQVKQTPVVLITFDDNWKSTKTIGKPVLDSLGFKASEFVIGITASQSQANRLHWADYDSLYQAGWDICNHTYRHDTLTSLNADQLEAEINGMRDYLIANRFTKIADFFAYPYGAFNLEVLNKVKEKHLLARNSFDWQYLAHPSSEVEESPFYESTRNLIHMNKQ